jgi:DNA polymerase III delta prime subunit
MPDILAQAEAGKLRFSLEEAKDILKRKIQYRQHIKTPRKHALLLIGPPGVGKTESIAQVAAEMKTKFICWQHGATIEEDNHGLQLIQNNVTVHAPTGTMKDAVCHPGEAVSDETIILCIDEVFTGSSKGHQNFVRMVIDRMYNEMCLRPGVIVVATSNPESAEHVTVESADSALVERMTALYIEPNVDECLRYWSKVMPPLIYKFLLLHHVQGKDIVSAMSPRSWTERAETLAEQMHGGAPRELLIKIMKIPPGSTELSGLFNAYLMNGSDMDKYPMNHNEVLFGTKEQVKACMARVERWVKKECRPLIGATKWDIATFLASPDNHEKMDDTAVKNLGKFLNIIGTGGYAALVEDICKIIRTTSLVRELLSEIRGTPLETRLKQILEATKVA